MTSLNPSLRLALINKAKNKKNLLQKGFTLIELLVTVVILGTLSAVAVPAYLNYADEGKLAAAEAEAINNLKRCIASQSRGGATTGCTVVGGNLTASSNVGITTEAVATANATTDQMTITTQPSI